MEALSRVILNLEQQPRWRNQGQLRRILASWQAIVGEQVARHSEPVRLAKGVLYVAVSNPTWAQTLTLERLRILDKMNQSGTAPLKDIRFSPGDWWQRQRPSEPVPQAALQAHPCYCPTEILPKALSESPEAAFQGWAERHRQMAQDLPRCPDCGCPCPSGELERWRRCSICAARGMG